MSATLHIQFLFRLNEKERNEDTVCPRSLVHIAHCYMKSGQNFVDILNGLLNGICRLFLGNYHSHLEPEIQKASFYVLEKIKASTIIHLICITYTTYIRGYLGICYALVK